MDVPYQDRISKAASGSGYRDRFVPIGERYLHYLDWGDPARPAVILLHGGAQNAHAWDRVAEHLADRYRVIVPDCRNHGDSDRWAEPYTYLDLADDVEAIVVALGLDRIGLIGHSMGGHQALHFAGRYPDRLHWLVIEDSTVDLPAFLREPRPANAFPARFETLAEIEAFLRRPMPYASDEYLHEKALFSKRPLADGGYAIKYLPGVPPAQPDGIDLWEVLAGIRCPTLLFWGEESNILDRASADRMIATLPNGRLVAVPRAGHLVHEDQPDQFNAAVSAFLEEIAE